MRVLITGASGLIGTNLALRLLDEGHQVLGVDKDPNPWTDRIPLHVQDLRSLDGEVDAILGHADVVVHLAARARVHESVEQPANALANYTITHHVLEYCRRQRTPLIFGSSRETYGEQETLPVREDAVRVEGAVSPYAAAKLAEEALIRAYGRCYGLAFVIFRFSNVYGRFDDLARNDRFIPRLCDRLPRGAPITIYGPEKRFDFTYIDDAIEGVYRGIERLVSTPSTVAGHAINLGTGQGTTLLEAAQILAAAIGVTPQLSFGPIQVGEISRYVADITKARALLDYRPRYAVADGIPELYRWWESWYGRRGAAVGSSDQAV